MLKLKYKDNHIKVIGTIRELYILFFSYAIFFRLPYYMIRYMMIFQKKVLALDRFTRVNQKKT